jgi:hypothetical protein
MRFLGLLLLLGAVACADSTGPHGGLLYRLREVDSRGLPAFIDSILTFEGTIRISLVGGDLELVGDSITLPIGAGQFHSDTTALVSLSIRSDYPDSSHTVDAALVGTYTVARDSTFVCWYYEAASMVRCEAQPSQPGRILARHIPIISPHDLLFTRD